MSSLVPSRQFVFSPDLAATIGLEEAILLQCLSDAQISNASERQSQFDWYEVNNTELATHLPFWTAQDIGRIAENLRQKGIVLIASPPLAECGHIRYAFNEKAQNTQKSVSEGSSVPASSTPLAKPISSQWQPDDASFKLLSQQGVPVNFARDSIPEFVQYWSERGEARHAWGNRFVTHALRRWRDYETHQNRKKNTAEVPTWAASTAQANNSQPMQRNWKPSTDALEILEIQAGIHRNFVEDAIPEFVLYWQEKGEHSNTWNARFINHVKRQWAGFRHATKNDIDPKPIDANWQPSGDVYDVLTYARIDLEFAQNLLPEFVIYWRDRNEARPSWNTLFLQFAKQQWRRQTAQETRNRDTRERTIAEDLSDRSWAN